MSAPIAIVLAGGAGSRLQPLTAARSKPSVPFGGRYRIVDFVLSNLVNSGIRTVYVVVQYKSQSLIEHLTHGWINSHEIPKSGINVVPPQMLDGPEWFQGTADAVRQNLVLIERHAPELVAVFGADHIYRMDVRQMEEFHRERDADVTVACIALPIAEADRFGVAQCEADGRVASFLEKPQTPPPMPGNPTRALCSMGNYLFKTDVLREALQAASGGEEPDFGAHVLPKLIGTNRVYAYDFCTNRVPGLKSYEDPSYWRDVGTLDAYFAANLDVLGAEPRFDLFNPQWQVHSIGYQGPPARVIGGRIENALIGGGTTVNGAMIRNSIVQREVRIEPGAVIEDSIILDYCSIGRGAHLRRTIVDRYNAIEPDARIGFDPARDRARFTVTENGIVALPKAAPDPAKPRYFF